MQLEILEQNRGKDFDIYFLPILLVTVVSPIGFIQATMASEFGDVKMRDHNCFPFVTVLFHSALSSCLMQIALNWMEVAG